MKTRKIDTWCYGEKHSFASKASAIKFYIEGINASEGSERERYLDIYSKLICNLPPFCDCDGVPSATKA